MHVALVIDEHRLVHEHPTLNRLVIGLIGEGVQVTRVVPETIDAFSIERDEQRVALAPRITTPMRILPWSRRDRAQRIAGALERKPPDVVFAVGEDAWTVGQDLARTVDVPLALEVWSANQVRRVPRSRPTSPIAAYIAPTRPIGEALATRVDPGLVCVIPMGVSMPPEPRTVLADAERAIALAITGSSRDVPAYRALLGGLSRVVRQTPQIQAFIELDGTNEHEIWRYARQLELLEHVSGLTDASQHRTLITRCDVLLMPEQYGEMYSLTLEAMSWAMPVLAADDPFLDILIDGETASVVPRPDAEEWARRLRRIVSDHEQARNLGRSARHYVEREHRSSTQAVRLAETFDQLLTGGAYRFRADD